MKKLLLSLVIIMAMIFSYSYQLPIMSREEAIVSAEKHLQNPQRSGEIHLQTLIGMILHWKILVHR